MFGVQIIGGGNMGTALAGGLLGSQAVTPREMCVVEPLPERRAYLNETLDGITLADTPQLARRTIIAVKPPDVVSVAQLLCEGTETVLSIAAGVTCASIEAVLDPNVGVVRAMPNTPAMVGVGASAIAPGTNATPQDMQWATEMLSSVGLVVTVAEDQLAAVTGLSGSGPAYVFLIAEALIEGGVACGLPTSVATQLAQQTLLGAATLMASSDDTPATLRENVTSPHGTTAAALDTLERNKLTGIIVEAVAAARDRANELAAS